VAHWDEERDARWLAMMRGCKVPNSEDFIKKFEATGDIIYFSGFVRHVRMTDESQRRRKALPSPLEPKQGNSMSTFTKSTSPAEN
jgi:hypothetical protein